MSPNIIFIENEPALDTDLSRLYSTDFNFFINENILNEYKDLGFRVDYSRDIIVNFKDENPNSPFSLLMKKVGGK